MSRRDTIIISVLVNAGLLLILFIASIISREDNITRNPTISSALIEESTFEAKDLFSEEHMENGIAINEEISKEEFVPIVEEKKEEKQEIIHKLPTVAKNKKKEIKPQPQENTELMQIIVKRGDTLDKLAKIHKTKISELIRINNLPSSFLRIGQTLSVPIPKESNIVKLDEKTTKKEIEKAPSVKEEYYIVKVGDNPYTIAMKHHIKPHVLLRLNNLDEKKARKLRPGDKLRIR